MEQAHRWRAQEKSYDFTYGASDDGKAVPAGFISELVVSYKDTSQSNPAIALTPLRKVQGGRIAWLLSRAPVTIRDSYYPQVAAPSLATVDDEYYYIWEEKIFIVPQPTTTKDYQLDYYGLVSVLVDPGTLTNFFTTNYYNCLKWGAMVEAWAMLHESQREALAEVRFDKLLTRAVKHDISIAMSGPPHSRGT